MRQRSERAAGSGSRRSTRISLCRSRFLRDKGEHCEITGFRLSVGKNVLSTLQHAGQHTKLPGPKLTAADVQVVPEVEEYNVYPMSVESTKADRNRRAIVIDPPREPLVRPEGLLDTRERQIESGPTPLNSNVAGAIDRPATPKVPAPLKNVQRIEAPTGGNPRRERDALEVSLGRQEEAKENQYRLEHDAAFSVAEKHWRKLADEGRFDEVVANLKVYRFARQGTMHEDPHRIDG